MPFQCTRIRDTAMFCYEQSGGVQAFPKGAAARLSHLDVLGTGTFRALPNGE